MNQLSLLSVDVVNTMTEDSKRAGEYKQGVYSGAQLKHSSPAMYQLICELLADGSLSQRQISERTGHSRNLISAISRQAADIEPLKQRIASRARNLAVLCLERAEEMIQGGDKVTLRDLAILAGVAVDKSQLLSGEATSRIETIEAASSADEFARQFDRLQQADVEELPAMGSRREEPAPKGAGLLAGGAAAADGADQAAGGDGSGAGGEDER